MKKIQLIFLVVLLLVILGGIFIWQQKSGKINTPPEEELKAYEFAGRIQSIEGSVIHTIGLFQIPGREDLSGPTYEKNMDIIVGSQTKLIKTVLQMPTDEELKKSNGYFDSNKLPKREVQGSLEELKEGIVDGVFAKSDSDIYKITSFTATEIKYFVPEYPQD